MKKSTKFQIVRLSLLLISIFMLASCTTRQAFSIVVNERNAEAEMRKTAMNLDKAGIYSKPERPDALADIDDEASEWDEDVDVTTFDATTLTQVQETLLREFYVWKGTPYRLGGNTMRGIDCSGFARHMYTALFSLNVPRSTREFMGVGQKIGRDSLQPGDLIIFSPRSYPRHVGIYIGENKFIHASSNKGVSMANLDSRYWKRAYRSARRLISQ